MCFSVEDIDELAMTSLGRATVFNDGTVLWDHAFRWVTSCPVDLTYFPYDVQHCTAGVVSWVYGSQSINFTKSRDNLVLAMYTESEEWIVQDSSVNDNPIIFHDDIWGHFALPYVEFSITLRRIPIYFENTIIIPCLVLSVMTVIVFILPSESGEKVR